MQIFLIKIAFFLLLFAYMQKKLYLCSRFCKDRKTNHSLKNNIVMKKFYKVQSTKVLRDGMLLIERGGRIYNAQGTEIH